MVQEFLPSHSQNVAAGGCQLYLKQIGLWIREGTMVTIGDRVRVLREEKKLSPGRRRKAHGLAVLLYLPCRKLSNGSFDRDAGEVGPGVEIANVSAVP